MSRVRIKVTWPLVALVTVVLAFASALVGLLVYEKVLDTDALKYLVGALVGSGLTAPLPLVSWFKEKKIRFELNGSDSDPPSGDKGTPS